MQNNQLVLDRDVTFCEGGVGMDGHVCPSDPPPAWKLSLACFWARLRDLQNVLIQSEEWVSYRGKDTFVRNYPGNLPKTTVILTKMPTTPIGKLFHGDGGKVHPPVLQLLRSVCSETCAYRVHQHARGHGAVCIGTEQIDGDGD